MFLFINVIFADNKCCTYLLTRSVPPGDHSERLAVGLLGCARRHHRPRWLRSPTRRSRGLRSRPHRGCHFLSPRRGMENVNGCHQLSGKNWRYQSTFELLRRVCSSMIGEVWCSSSKLAMTIMGWFRCSAELQRRWSCQKHWAYIILCLCIRCILTDYSE